MKKEELRKQWLAEEQIAHIRGWDFSHIHGKYEEENDLPWDYRQIITSYLKPESHLLDIDTGGGEFLLSLNHPYKKTSATEAYTPNIELCREILLPLEIDFKETDETGILPFKDAEFDIIINRHGKYDEKEISRVLKQGGIFITEQVGAENDRELVELLLPEKTELPFPEQYLQIAAEKFEGCGFSVINGQEVFRPIKFWDVGALVWFAHIIEWEFPDFSVEKSLEKLYSAQELLERESCIEGKAHRFLLVVRKN